MQCVTDGVANANIRWFEYATTVNGDMISDGTVLIDSHPNRARYSINNNSTRTFNLIISNVNLQDAGYYECVDSNASPPAFTRLGADLIILETNPKCNATYPFDTGAVVENQYHSVQCIQTYNASDGIVPLMTWTGPPPFNYGYSFNKNVVWSGINFFADRSMTARNWICRTNFTSTGFTGPSRDVVPPSYDILSPSNQIFVFWPPGNMTAYPIQATYEIGQTVTCWADAFPIPEYSWQSLRNSEQWFSSSFTTHAGMVGYQLMRCTAKNNIIGFDYQRDFFLDVSVNPATTPTIPTTPATTTLPPAFGTCPTLTGMWRSASPSPTATLCITVTVTDNDARITGLYKNGTDNFWMNILGKTRVNNTRTLGWTMLFPSGMVGVSSYAAECHNCFGTEQILANGISRTTSSSQFCASGGLVNSSPQFVFYRATPVYPCTSNPTEMARRMELNARGKLFAETLEE